MSKTKEEILEGNKLIAEFMGAKINQPYPSNKEQNGLIFYYPDKCPDPVSRYHSTESIKYHSSWDWLMPVVEKIESMSIRGKGVRVAIFRKCCDISLDVESDNLIENGATQSKINSAFLSVVEFIKWYNQNQ